MKSEILMTFEELAVLICDLEGKKQQVDIAQVSEILKCLKTIIQSDPQSVLFVLLQKPYKKAKARLPKKK